MELHVVINSIRVHHFSSTLPISERSDDEPRSVTQVLMGVSELGVTDVGKTVLLPIVPPVSELRQPGERLGILNLEIGMHG